MKKSRLSEAQIAGLLKKVKLDTKVNETCRKHSISEPAYYSQLSGMTVSHLAQLRQLQDENAKLEHM